MVAVDAGSPTVDSLDAVSSSAVGEVDSGSAEIVSALDEGLDSSADVMKAEVVCGTTDGSSEISVVVSGTVVTKMNKKTIQVFVRDTIDQLFRTRSEVAIDSLFSDAIEVDDSRRGDKIFLVIDS